MKSHYPKVLEQSEYIQKIVKSEEDRFNATLNDGIALLNEVIADTKQAGKRKFQVKQPSNYMILTVSH